MRVSNISILFATVCCLVAASASSASHKRIPSGFTGVRGKKSDGDGGGGGGGAGEILLNDDEDDRRDGGGRGGNNVAHSEMVKRAPAAGFLGVRGKKPFDGWINDHDDEGGRPLFEGPSGLSTAADQKDEAFKRAPNGFMGMRGKKPSTDAVDRFILNEPSLNSLRRDDVVGGDGGGGGGLVLHHRYMDMDRRSDKRVPLTAGFNGMRGKKRDARSGFFGMRGKKYPYEFRGKFVGVRGKKSTLSFGGGFGGGVGSVGGGGDHFPPSSAIDDYFNFKSANPPIDINQMMLLLTENNNNNDDDPLSNTYQDYQQSATNSVGN